MLNRSSFSRTKSNNVYLTPHGAAYNFHSPEQNPSVSLILPLRIHSTHSPYFLFHFLLFRAFWHVTPLDRSSLLQRQVPRPFHAYIRYICPGREYTLRKNYAATVKKCCIVLGPSSWFCLSQRLSDIAMAVRCNLCTVLLRYPALKVR